MLDYSSFNYNYCKCNYNIVTWVTFAVKIQKAEPFKKLAHFQVKNRVKVSVFF